MKNQRIWGSFRPIFAFWMFTVLSGCAEFQFSSNAFASGDINSRNVLRIEVYCVPRDAEFDIDNANSAQYPFESLTDPQKIHRFLAELNAGAMVPFAIEGQKRTYRGRARAVFSNGKSAHFFYWLLSEANVAQITILPDPGVNNGKTVDKGGLKLLRELTLTACS